MPSNKFPSTITKIWIAQQESAYCGLCDYIIHLLSFEGYDEFELSNGLQRVWLICRLESDVWNGGFGQFLGNAHDSRDGSDRFLRITMPAVRAFGLVELEPLVRETIRIADEIMAFELCHRRAEERNIPTTLTCAIRRSDAETTAFQEATEARFAELWDKWTKIDHGKWHFKVEQYIRAHLGEFVFDTCGRRAIELRHHESKLRSHCIGHDRT
jgi:hypothetical protein